MKKGIHPENYRPVVFKDMSNGDMFLSRSTCATKETIEFEGETYPLVKLEISSTSHPFYTGKSKLVDTAGRVDKFMSRYGKKHKEIIFHLFFYKKRKPFVLPFLFSHKDDFTIINRCSNLVYMIGVKKLRSYHSALLR